MDYPIVTQIMCSEVFYAAIFEILMTNGGFKDFKSIRGVYSFIYFQNNCFCLKDDLITSKIYLALEGKKYQNNFQEHNFLRDLKIPPIFPCYVEAEKRSGISNPVINRFLESCSNIVFTLIMSLKKLSFSRFMIIRDINNI